MDYTNISCCTCENILSEVILKHQFSMLTVPSHISQNLFENNKSKINLSQFLIESFKDISKVFVNPQSQVIINQKFEKYISVSIYHYQQKVLYEFSLCTEPSSKMFYRKVVLKNFLNSRMKTPSLESHTNTGVFL